MIRQHAFGSLMGCLGQFCLLTVSLHALAWACTIAMPHRGLRRFQCHCLGRGQALYPFLCIAMVNGLDQLVGKEHPTWFHLDFFASCNHNLSCL